VQQPVQLAGVHGVQAWLVQSSPLWQNWQSWAPLPQAAGRVPSSQNPLLQQPAHAPQVEAVWHVPLMHEPLAQGRQACPPRPHSVSVCIAGAMHREPLQHPLQAPQAEVVWHCPLTHAPLQAWQLSPESPQALEVSWARWTHTLPEQQPSQVPHPAT
jgi:hypothetical protein